MQKAIYRPNTWTVDQEKTLQVALSLGLINTQEHQIAQRRNNQEPDPWAEDAE